MTSESPNRPCVHPRARPGSATGILVAVVLSCFVSPPLGAAEPMEEVRSESPPLVEILGFDGRWIHGRLEALEGEAWSIRRSDADETSDAVTMPAASVAACIVAPRSTDLLARSRAPARISIDLVEPIGLGLLETRDGQRLVGTLRIVAGSAIWDHRWIGAVPLDLERISTLRIGGDAVPSRRPDADVVRLSNGDLVTGFVDSIGSDVVLAPLGDDVSDPTSGSREVRRIPVERVASIAFADVGSTPRTGSDAWTVDGTSVAMRDLSFTKESGWGFTLADAWIGSVRPNPTDDNRAADPLAILPARNRVIPVSSFELTSVERADGEFRTGVRDAVRIGPAHERLLGLAEIAIDGGVVARFAPPQDGLSTTNASLVLTASLALVEPAPVDAAVDVEISLGVAPPQRFRLDRANPRFECVLRGDSTDGADVVLRVTDGGNGPAGDRVVIERAALLVSPNRVSPLD